MTVAASRKGSVTNPRSWYSSAADLEKLRHIYRHCKHKSCYPDGRPRPCRSPRCPCEACRRKYAEKEAAILKRSFRDRPPDFTFTLKLVDGNGTPDVLMALYLRTFTQKFRDFRKAEGAVLEYDIRIEFRHQQPHAHLTVITSLNWSRNGIKELVKGWWAMCCPDRQTAVYCDQVQNVVGLANYVTKNVKDRSKVEMPPQDWNGRRCRLVWRSRGFLTKSKDRLWQEQRAEWYPQPVAVAASFGEGKTLEIMQGAKNRPTSPAAARWTKRWLEGPTSHLRLAVALPAGFGRAVQPLEGVRAVQTARGP
jgi:hypothetical protein